MPDGVVEEGNTTVGQQLQAHCCTSVLSKLSEIVAPQIRLEQPSGLTRRADDLWMLWVTCRREELHWSPHERVARQLGTALKPLLRCLRVDGLLTPLQKALKQLLGLLVIGSLARRQRWGCCPICRGRIYSTLIGVRRRSRYLE
jgi:hypothetical protein